MKVLHVIPNLLKGGAQRLVIDICNKLLDYNEIDCKLIKTLKLKMGILINDSNQKTGLRHL